MEGSRIKETKQGKQIRSLTLHKIEFNSMKNNISNSKWKLNGD